MPNKKLLIGGAIAIGIALAAYIVTTPKEVKNAPVSSEEFNQEMQGLDFATLTGSEREKAVSHLRDMAEGLTSGRGPMGGRGPGGDRGPRDGRETRSAGSSEQRPERRNPMESLEPEERRQIMEPALQHSREEEEKRMEEFFKKSPEEQNAELDQIVDRMERWGEMRRQREATAGSSASGSGRAQTATGRNEGDAARRQTASGRTEGGSSGSPNQGRRRGGRRTPDESKRRSLARLQRGTSESRAKRQEFMRRIAERGVQRKQAAQKAGAAAAAAAAAKRQAEERARQAERQQRKPVTEEIIVEEAAKDGLQKVKIGDPLTIANVAKPDEVQEVIVARAGKRLGELPPAKQIEYAEYISKHRRIWAKVLEVAPASKYLKIEVNVE